MTTQVEGPTRARRVRLGGRSAAQIIDITQDGAVVLVDEERALLPVGELVGVDLIVGEWVRVTPVSRRPRRGAARRHTKDCNTCPAASTCAKARAPQAVRVDLRATS